MNNSPLHLLTCTCNQPGPSAGMRWSRFAGQEYFSSRKIHADFITARKVKAGKKPDLTVFQEYRHPKVENAWGSPGSFPGTESCQVKKKGFLEMVQNVMDILFKRFAGEHPHKTVEK